MIKNFFSETVIFLPKSAAKVAAAFLVLTSPQYNANTDVPRAKQSKIVAEQEIFIKPQRGYVVVGLTAFYSQPTDVVRPRGQKFYQEQEVYLKTQPSSLNVVLASYAAKQQTFFTPRAVLSESVSIIKPNRGTANTLNVLPPPATSGDIFVGQDTYGWPPFEEPWSPPQRGSRIVRDAFAQYNPATDVQRAKQAKVFQEPDFWIPPDHTFLVTDNVFSYNPATDVRFAKQSKFFAEPDFFVKTKAPLSVALNFTPYAPASDVQRSRQSKYFEEQASYPQRAPFNTVITNGLVQVSPLEFATGIDVYDNLNGSFLVAWGQFRPKPSGYNIYVNGVFNQTVNGLLATITGLTTVSYNVATQTYTPSGTYQIKVVAVSNGQETGEISKTITASPTSVMSTTPMKRLWPFPNTGLD